MRGEKVYLVLLFICTSYVLVNPGRAIADFPDNVSNNQKSGSFQLYYQPGDTEPWDRDLAWDNPPDRKIIGMANSTSGPVRLDQYTVSVAFAYSDPVDIVVGIISNDFERVYWLDPDTCDFHSSFNMKSRVRTLICGHVPIFYEESGYVFWIVSAVPLEQLNWETGPYELRFFPYTIIFIP